MMMHDAGLSSSVRGHAFWFSGGELNKHRKLTMGRNGGTDPLEAGDV
jgi:hypothetical protein